MFSTIELLPLFSVLLLPVIVDAVAFPPPTGQYHVGITQHVFNHTTPNDPVAPANASSDLLITIYYPTLTVPTPENTYQYLDPVTAQLWGSALQFPPGTLENLTTWTQWQAQTLNETLGLPTIILSPGGGVNAIMYNVLSSELASRGYTVVAIDHPGEAPFLQLPYDGAGIYGIDITASWNVTLQGAVYEYRVSDAVAVMTTLWPTLVELFGAPFNATHFFMLGHSLGGAAAAGAIAQYELLDSASCIILGGVNLDGLFVDTPDVKRPFLLIAGEEHTPEIDSTWAPFSANQSGWWEWLNVTGSDHLQFSDIGDWVDLLGLRNKTITPQIGPIWSPRMNYIVTSFITTFWDFVLGKPQDLLQGPSGAFPEVVFMNSSHHVR